MQKMVCVRVCLRDGVVRAEISSVGATGSLFHSSCERSGNNRLPNRRWSNLSMAGRLACSAARKSTNSLKRLALQGKHNLDPCLLKMTSR